MNLTIDIPSETERRLKAEATRLGLDEIEYARRLIEQSLPPELPPADQATLELLARWEQEDQTTDPDEIARRQREFDELKAALNQNRRDAGGPNARTIFP